jgi:lipid A disaccharide synthetase
MSLRLLKRQFSKVAVLAGSSCSDRRGAQIIASLKKVAPDTSFFGIAGPEMEREGVTPIVEARALPQRWFFPLFNFRLDPRFVLSIYMIPENLRLLPTLIKLYQNGFWKNFGSQKKEEVDMVVTIDNDLLNFRVNELMNYCYNDRTVIKPLRVHFGLTVRNYTYDHLRTLDYLVYTLPIPSADRQLFNFPSQFVGVQAIYDVLKFVMQANQNFVNKIHEDHLVVDQEAFFDLIRQFQLNRKHFYRQKISVAPNSWVFFFSPGYTEEQVRANSRVIQQAIRLMKHRMPENQQMVAIISLPEKAKVGANWVEHFKDVDAVVRFIYDDNQNAKFEALAASDFAAIQGADTVFQAATFQVPTVILDDSPGFLGYVTLMHNVYSSQINMAIGGELFPEMTIRNFGSKLVEFLEEWIQKPHLKVEVARRWFKHVLEFLPREKNLRFPHPPSDPLAKTEIRLYNPAYVTDEFLQHIYKEFRAVKACGKSIGEQEARRKDLILGPE